LEHFSDFNPKETRRLLKILQKVGFWNPLPKEKSAKKKSKK
jgi:hypothetical protein